MKVWIIIVLLVLGIGSYVYFTVNNDVILEENSPLVNSNEMDAAMEDMKDKIIEMDENIDSKANLIAEGHFKEKAHHVDGKAFLIEEDGKKIVRLEDFDTINGPALYIYLSSGLGDDDFVDLGPIKATKGNINYEVPAGTNTDKYNKVLVWCRPFRVLFSYAELK